MSSNRRNVPVINYQENSDSEDFESSNSDDFVSPPPGTPSDGGADGLGQFRGVTDQLGADQAIIQAAAQLAAIMPPKYDAATGNDEDDVYNKLSTLKSPFTTDDPKFWFNNFERTIKHFGIKSQTTKYEALINQLGKEVTEEVKGILRLDDDELGATPYLTLKTELLSLYSPRPEDCFAKAASRVLVGKPSTLGKQIINDFCLCATPLSSKCCANIAYGMWVKNLPTYVKAFISKEAFNKDTYKKVFEMADKVWLTHRTEAPAVAAIKAEQAEALAGSNDLENPAVAAIRRGGGRGNRRGSGRGGRSNRGGGRGGQRQPQGPKHPQALEGSCYVHHQYGPEAWSCADRHKCPMRDIESPKPSHNRNIPIESNKDKK